MKKNNLKSLTLVKKTIAKLESKDKQQIVGGGSQTNCNQRSLYKTSCHVH